MKTDSTDYNLFLKFIETFAPNGFKNIDRSHPLILELEEQLQQRNQFFFMADILQGKILFSSKRSIDMVGVDADELNPYHMIEAVHPTEVYRNTNGWAKLLSYAGNILNTKTEKSVVSTNMKMRNPKGGYSEILYQCYLFYSNSTNNTVYDLQIHTNIDKLLTRKSGYHYYAGHDISKFRYPDCELLSIGNPLSNREFEIVNLIALGLNSEEIAAKLFLSVHTINTHRRNLLGKLEKKTMPELIFEMKEQGFM